MVHVSADFIIVTQAMASVKQTQSHYWGKHCQQYAEKQISMTS